MTTQSTGMERKSLDAPDETRQVPKGRIEVVKLGNGVTLSRATLEPGWRWSQDIKPIANTESCTAPHTGYAIAGRLHVRMDDGSEQEFGPGDAMAVPPGHDAWVVGNEPYVGVDFTGAPTMLEYMKQ